MTPDVIEQVALVTGRILHEGTGEPVVGNIRIVAKEGRVVDKVLADGTFVISGRSEQLFPDLATQGYQLTLNIRAESAQFWQGLREEQLLVSIPMGFSFAAPIDGGIILFPADPVNVRGRVVEATNPEAPIPNATVEVLHSGAVIGSALTNSEGRYRLDDITVTAPAEIRCSAVGFITQTRILLVNFGQLINREDFYLPPPS